MKCQKCKITIDKSESIQTIDNKTLCFGCDTKRLIDNE